MKATTPPRSLRLSQDVLAERRLARRLRPEDLRHAAARDAADAEGQVERDRAGGDRVDVLLLGRAELHDRAAAELLLDGQDGGVDRLAFARSTHGRPPSALVALRAVALRARLGSVPVIVIDSPPSAAPTADQRDGLRLVRRFRFPTRLPLWLDDLYGLRR